MTPEHATRPATNAAAMSTMRAAGFMIASRPLQARREAGPDHLEEHGGAEMRPQGDGGGEKRPDHDRNRHHRTAALARRRRGDVGHGGLPEALVTPSVT